MMFKVIFLGISLLLIGCAEYDRKYLIRPAIDAHVVFTDKYELLPDKGCVTTEEDDICGTFAIEKRGINAYPHNAAIESKFYVYTGKSVLYSYNYPTIKGLCVETDQGEAACGNYTIIENVPK